MGSYQHVPEGYAQQMVEVNCLNAIRIRPHENQHLDKIILTPYNIYAVYVMVD
jgi:hypothetical protein